MQSGLRAWEAARDDLLHAALYALALLGAQVPQVALGFEAPCDHIRLAEGSAARSGFREADVGATHHCAHIEGQVRLHQLRAKRINDAHTFVDCTVAGLLGKHAGRMPGLTLHLQSPTARGAARDACGVHAFVTDAAFKRECVVRPLRQFHHRRPRGAQRRASALFIAGEEDVDARAVERANAVERAQRLDHDHVSALHVAHALATDAVTAALPQRHSATLFEHGVQVTEQEQMLTLRADPGRFKMAGALHLSRHVNPSCLEAEAFEFGAKDLTNRTHAFAVQRAAVDADRFLQQLQGLRTALPDGVGNALLGIAQLGMSRTRGKDGQRQQAEDALQDGISRKSRAKIVARGSRAIRLAPRAAARSSAMARSASSGPYRRACRSCRHCRCAWGPW